MINSPKNPKPNKEVENLCKWLIEEASPQDFNRATRKLLAEVITHYHHRVESLENLSTGGSGEFISH